MNPSGAGRRAPVIPTVSTVGDLPRRRALGLSVTSMTFSEVGQNQSIVVSEADYRGTFYAGSTDPAVAQVTPANARGPAAGFAVIAVASGSCEIRLTGESGRSDAIAVVVDRRQRSRRE